MLQLQNLIGFNNLHPNCTIVTRGIKVSRPFPSSKTVRIKQNQSLSIPSGMTGNFFDVTHISIDSKHITLAHLDLKNACFYMDWDKANKNWKYDIAIDPNDLRQKIEHFQQTLVKFSCT